MVRASSSVLRGGVLGDPLDDGADLGRRDDEERLHRDALEQVEIADRVGRGNRSRPLPGRRDSRQPVSGLRDRGGCQHP
jgi:hypothetical protein